MVTTWTLVHVTVRSQHPSEYPKVQEMASRDRKPPQGKKGPREWRGLTRSPWRRLREGPRCSHGRCLEDTTMAGVPAKDRDHGGREQWESGTGETSTDQGVTVLTTLLNFSRDRDGTEEA